MQYTVAQGCDLVRADHQRIVPVPRDGLGLGDGEPQGAVARCFAGLFGFIHGGRRLLEGGYAYESYSTPEEIEARHVAAGRDPKLGYDGFDRDLTPEQLAEEKKIADDTHQHFVSDVGALADEVTASWKVALAWAVVWVPLAYGIWKTLETAAKLFK